MKSEFISELKNTYKKLPVSRWHLEDHLNNKNIEDEKLDNIAEEQAVALIYNGISHAVMMATPMDLKEFAIGFSLSEGIIQQPSEIFDIECLKTEKGIEVSINISSKQMVMLKNYRRSLTGRTGCGLCGSESLEQAMRAVNKVNPTELPSHQAIQCAVSELEKYQHLQALTGAAHGAAWCDLQGNILLVKEDVGRHNALDKLIGYLAINSIKTNNGFILISSRASYEMVQKTCSFNVATLIAVSAATGLAIDLAKQSQLNLVGFARKNRHVIYNQGL